MTLALAWTNNKTGMVQVVADTRVASALQHGSIRISDHGTKIISIPYRCSQISSGEPGVQRQPFFWGSIGFVFAGNVNAALMSATTTTTLLSQLVSVDSKYPPKMSELAHFIAQVCTQYARDSLSAYNGKPSGGFECLIVGKCPSLNNYEIYRLNCFSPSHCKFGKPNLINPSLSGYEVIGSGKNRFLEKFSKISANNTDQAYLKAFEEVIREDSLDVGGYTSFGLTTGYEFLPAWIPEYVSRTSNEAFRSYNGIDIDEIGPIGPCVIGGIGMAVKPTPV